MLAHPLCSSIKRYKRLHLVLSVGKAHGHTLRDSLGREMPELTCTVLHVLPSFGSEVPNQSLIEHTIFEPGCEHDQGLEVSQKTTVYTARFAGRCVLELG